MTLQKPGLKAFRHRSVGDIAQELTQIIIALDHDVIQLTERVWNEIRVRREEQALSRDRRVQQEAQRFCGIVLRFPRTDSPASKLDLTASAQRVKSVAAQEACRMDRVERTGGGIDVNSGFREPYCALAVIIVFMCDQAPGNTVE